MFSLLCNCCCHSVIFQNWRQPESSMRSTTELLHHHTPSTARTRLKAAGWRVRRRGPRHWLPGSVPDHFLPHYASLMQTFEARRQRTGFCIIADCDFLFHFTLLSFRHFSVLFPTFHHSFFQFFLLLPLHHLSLAPIRTCSASKATRGSGWVATSFSFPLLLSSHSAVACSVRAERTPGSPPEASTRRSPALPAHLREPSEWRAIVLAVIWWPHSTGRQSQEPGVSPHLTGQNEPLLIFLYFLLSMLIAKERSSGNTDKCIKLYAFTGQWHWNCSQIRHSDLWWVICLGEGVTLTVCKRMRHSEWLMDAAVQKWDQIHAVLLLTHSQLCVELLRSTNIRATRHIIWEEKILYIKWQIKLEQLVAECLKWSLKSLYYIQQMCRCSLTKETLYVSVGKMKVGAQSPSACVKQADMTQACDTHSDQTSSNIIFWLFDLYLFIFFRIWYL